MNEDPYIYGGYADPMAYYCHECDAPEPFHERECSYNKENR